jgi:hypothetical protein
LERDNNPLDAVDSMFDACNKPLDAVDSMFDA